MTCCLNKEKLGILSLKFPWMMSRCGLGMGNLGMYVHVCFVHPRMRDKFVFVLCTIRFSMLILLSSMFAFFLSFSLVVIPPQKRLA